MKIIDRNGNAIGLDDPIWEEINQQLSVIIEAYVNKGYSQRDIEMVLYRTIADAGQAVNNKLR